MRSILTASSLLAFALSIVLVPPRADAQVIDLPGTQPHELDTAAEPLRDSSRCAGCHFEQNSTTASHMPNDTWLGSMMANAMRDPLFLAALTVAEQDRPGTGDYCLRCHTPLGFVGGRTRSTDPSVHAGLGTVPPLTASDLDGVTCDACHRMTADSHLSNAEYVLSPTTERFGPYADSVSMAHASTMSGFTSDPKLCGTCHEIRNPVQTLHDATTGADTGRPFPLDTTYTEWAQSAFAIAGDPNARTCQDCHMPRADGDLFVATSMSALPRTAPRRHDFVGGNAWMVDVLAQMRGDATLTDFYNPTLVPYYQLTAQRARDGLRTAATVQVSDVPASAAPGATVTVSVRVENLTGHKFPSGYADGRRAWIALDLLDAAGNATPVSGHYDDASAALDEADPQLRAYAAVHGRAGQGAEDHIALHDQIVRDTRIPPRGFVPASDADPVGRDYTGGAGGALRNDDTAHYTFTIPASATGPYTVRARLLYQSTTRAYVEFLASENHTDDRGQQLLARWQSAGRAPPDEVASATATIAAAPAPPAQTGCGCTTPARRPRTTTAVFLALIVALTPRGKRVSRVAPLPTDRERGTQPRESRSPVATGRRGDGATGRRGDVPTGRRGDGATGPSGLIAPLPVCRERGARITRLTPGGEGSEVEQRSEQGHADGAGGEGNAAGGRE